jgi:hypothetical protein
MNSHHFVLQDEVGVPELTPRVLIAEVRRLTVLAAECGFTSG